METTTEKSYLTNDYFKKEGLREFYTMKELHKHLATNSKVWSWGANGYTNVENRMLRFKVQGHHFKGLVWIAVNGSDLFNIYLSKSRRSENGCYELVEKIEDVYLEDLMERLDKRIEYIAAYKY